MSRDRRLPLQLKLTFWLVLIVMLPLGVSIYLMNQIATTSSNVAIGEAASRIEVMEKAFDTYHSLVDTTKRLDALIAERLALRPDILALDPMVNLAKIINDEPALRGIAILRSDGSELVTAERPLPSPQWRDMVLDEPIGTSGATLRLTFMVSAGVNSDLGNLKRAIDSARQFSQSSTDLALAYRTPILVLLSIAGLIAAAFGIWAASFVTRRITALVTTARKVSEGRLDARVELRGHDEMAELGVAFNTMLDDLDQTRAQLEYLQRMGVWQDVARRLAHEIKNPLTPIQLAVQQCVSAYKGDDARFKKLLADTGEIVEEEIAGLRRLVDTFRTLGALPKVEKAPIVLADVLDELRLDPTMASRIALDPPARPVTVRADKLLLKRVLANLIENGIHAGQEAGNAGDVVVGWRVDPRAENVLITVDDHGTGVPEASRETIFEPYVTTKSTGTGLGLAIARKIAIEHGGELSVAPDRAPTGGARFVVSLPLRGPEMSLG